jgi:predicted DNA-binding transcriptional regulator AlpA
MSELLNVEQLAEELKVPRSWVYGQSRKRGPDSMPMLKFGKYLRFRKADVVQWAERQARVSMTE